MSRQRGSARAALLGEIKERHALLGRGRPSSDVLSPGSESRVVSGNDRGRFAHAEDREKMRLRRAVRTGTMERHKPIVWLELMVPGSIKLTIEDRPCLSCFACSQRVASRAGELARCPLHPSTSIHLCCCSVSVARTGRCGLVVESLRGARRKSNCAPVDDHPARSGRNGSGCIRQG